MTHYYLDTNIIFKYYKEEIGTFEVTELVSNNSCFISGWGIVELLQTFKGALLVENQNKEERAKRELHNHE